MFPNYKFFMGLILVIAICGLTRAPQARPVDFSKVKSGTLSVLQILQDNGFPEREDIEPGELLTRVEKQKYYDTPAGHFRIQYDTIGPHVVYQAGIDIDPEDGHPDFVNRCADYFEESWTLFDTLGYSMPPFDGDAGGGHDLYDVYMHQYQFTYGITWPDEQSTQYPNRPNSFTSYIYVDPRYDGFGYPDPTLPLKVTAVHQFYHAVQFSYNLWAGVWFMENSSMWAEDILYDDVNDNYKYLPSFYDYPHFAHDTENSAHEFGMFVWPQYIFQNFGIDAVREIWEMTIHEYINDALDMYFNSMGTTLRDTYRDFMIWNYFTGSRDDGAHFEEGTNYPLVSVMRTHNTLPVYNQLSSAKPSGIGSNYVVFNGLDGFTGPIRLEIDGTDGHDWAIDAVIFEQGGEIRYKSVLCSRNGYGSVLVNVVEPVESITMIVTLLSAANLQDFSYSAYVDSFISVDENGPVPEEFILLGNFPNPFNSSTIINFTLPEPGNIRLDVYNLWGQIIHQSFHHIIPGGTAVSWDGGTFSSGIYFYSITCNGRSLTGRMTLLK